jgi:hypothetical protein
MSHRQPLTKAQRQIIIVGIISYLIGFIGMLAVVGWLMNFSTIKEGSWKAMLHVGPVAIICSLVFGGLSFAAVSMGLLRRHHFRHGVHHCPYCDRPLKGTLMRCGCPGAQASRR